MYLLDTSVISASAPSKRERPENLVAWLDAASKHLFISVITASEIVSGITAAERRGHSARAEKLRRWWELVRHLYGPRVLPIDLAVAETAGRMMDRCRAFDPGYQDIAIASTAEVNGLTVLTANETHFRPLGIPWANPLKVLPPLPS